MITNGAATQTATEERLYRIGEVSRLAELKPFVLRYWETEFPMLEPVKSPSGHRMYRQEDVDMVMKIKRLLYDEGFTIAGARQHLKSELKPARRQDGLPFPKPRSGDSLKKVRQGLQEILGILNKKRR